MAKENEGEGAEPKEHKDAAENIGKSEHFFFIGWCIPHAGRTKGSFSIFIVIDFYHGWLLGRVVNRWGGRGLIKVLRLSRVHRVICQSSLTIILGLVDVHRVIGVSRGRDSLVFRAGMIALTALILICY